MNEKKKNNNFFNSLFWTIIFSMLFVSVYYIFFYRNANSDYVEAYENVNDYYIYNGKDVYEYWKTTLDDNQQVLYEEMKEAYLQFIEYFSMSSKEMSEDEFQEVYVAVLLDHPEIFWMDSYQIIVKPFSNMVNTKKTVKLFFSVDKEEAKKTNDKIQPVYSKIISDAKELDSDYDKVLFVHDTLIKNTIYTDYSSENRHDYQSIVSIFRDKKSVCAGYTYGFKLIMDNIGIDAVSVRDVGNKNEDNNHIWNMVKLFDVWFNIDLTWDDQETNGKDVYYKFFLKTDDEFYDTHKKQDKMPSNNINQED